MNLPKRRHPPRGTVGTFSIGTFNGMEMTERWIAVIPEG